MPNVHGIEFDVNQAELVKDLVRELLKDGDCAVYAVHNMQPRRRTADGHNATQLHPEKDWWSLPQNPPGDA